MNAEHRHELETNSLAEGANRILTNLREGSFWNPKVIVPILVVCGVIGFWYYALKKSRTADSKMWAEYTQVVRAEDWKTLADNNKGHNIGRLAELERARTLLGPQGIHLLKDGDKARRRAGIDNIVTARESLLSLSEAFKGDLTLRTECYLQAATAELSLVKITKEGTTEPLGTVDKGCELIRKAAKSVGEKTTLGEKLMERADKIAAEKNAAEQIGNFLNETAAPPPPLPAVPSSLFPDKTPVTPVVPPMMPIGTTGAAIGTTGAPIGTTGK